jgi:hypothetical protein
MKLLLRQALLVQFVLLPFAGAATEAMPSSATQFVDKTSIKPCGVGEMGGDFSVDSRVEDCRVPLLGGLIACDEIPPEGVPSQGRHAGATDPSAAGRSLRRFSGCEVRVVLGAPSSSGGP